MSRLGKTPMNTMDEMKLLHNHTLSTHRFAQNRIFLMELGQLSVEDKNRANQFVDDIEIFLNLRKEEDDNDVDGNNSENLILKDTSGKTIGTKNTIHDMSTSISTISKSNELDQKHILPRLKEHNAKHNISPKVDTEKVNERSIDICDPKFDDLRKILISIGANASQ